MFLYAESENTVSVVLTSKKPVRFAAERLFECTDEFINKYGNKGQVECPKDIENLIHELENGYIFNYIRYDGKILSWHFPDKWYHNLGKKIWG